MALVDNGNEIVTPSDALDAANNVTEVIPKLIQEDSGLEFAPRVVTKLAGTLPFDTNSEQLQCGKTVTESDGDLNIQLNMEAVVPHSKLKTIHEMRQYDSQIELVSAAYSGAAKFDQLKFDRLPDANGAMTVNGSVEEPWYTVQLQSKEDDEGGLLG